MPVVDCDQAPCLFCFPRQRKKRKPNRRLVYYCLQSRMKSFSAFPLSFVSWKIAFSTPLDSADWVHLITQTQGCLPIYCQIPIFRNSLLLYPWFFEPSEFSNRFTLSFVLRKNRDFTLNKLWETFATLFISTIESVGNRRGNPDWFKGAGKFNSSVLVHSKNIYLTSIMQTVWRSQQHRSFKLFQARKPRK